MYRLRTFIASPLPVMAIACVLFFAFFSSAQAQTSLTGKVIDQATGIGLPAAVVTIYQDSTLLSFTTTDTSGSYALNGLAPGKRRLEVQYLGYELKKESITIEAGGSQKLNIILVPLSFKVNAVEILAQGNEVSSSTGAIVQLSPKTIALIQPIGTQELLSYVPGITGFSDDGMGNSRINIGIRGLNPRRSKRTLILEDGIPIQPAIYTYSNMYYNPPAERIQGLEVIKGSGAVKFGPNTMGGVINYITSRPRDDFGGVVQLVGGNNGYFSAYTELGGSKSQTLDPEVQLLYKRSNGYRDNNDFYQVNGTFKLNYKSKKGYHRLYIKLNGNYEDNNATYTGLTEYSFATNPRFNPKKDDNFKVFRTSADVIYTNLIKGKVEEKVTFYVNYFDRRWWRGFDVFVKASDYEQGNIIPVPFLTNGDLVRTGTGVGNMGILRTFYVAGTEAQYGWNHSLGKHTGKLNFGARLHYEHFTNKIKTGEETTSRNGEFYDTNVDGDTTFTGTWDDFDTYAFSAYALEEFQFGNLTLSPGVRLEVYHQTSYDNLNDISGSGNTIVALPGLGFNYKIKKWALFGGVHRGFTPASRSSLLQVDFSAGVVNDKVLKPERSWNFEMGVRANHKYYSLEVSGFYLLIKDLVEVSRGADITNVGLISTRGVENAFLAKFDAVNKWLPNLQVIYTFLNTRIHDGTLGTSAVSAGASDVSGNELPYAPHHNVTVALLKDFDFGLSLRFDVQYVAQSFSDIENLTYTFNRGDTGPIPAHTLINASASYRFRKIFEVFISGKNLADNIYIGSRLHSAPNARDASASSGILVGARRQINVGFRYMFGK